MIVRRIIEKKTLKLFPKQQRLIKEKHQQQFDKYRLLPTSDVLAEFLPPWDMFICDILKTRRTSSALTTATWL